MEFFQRQIVAESSAENVFKRILRYSFLYSFIVRINSDESVSLYVCTLNFTSRAWFGMKTNM